MHELRLANQAVYSVLESDSAYEAFFLLKAAVCFSLPSISVCVADMQRVTGCAVVNDNGAMVGNISISDIKHIGKKAKRVKHLFDVSAASLHRCIAFSYFAQRVAAHQLDRQARFDCRWTKRLAGTRAGHVCQVQSASCLRARCNERTLRRCFAWRLPR